MKKEIIEICQRLHRRNLLAAADGNISFKVSEEEILITPSGMPKAFISESDIAVMNISGEIVSGTPSSEKLMHLSVYRKCPNAKAVVHAHPPTAIAWSLAYPVFDKLPSDVLPEVLLATGDIPIVPYARPGTEKMGTNLEPYLPSSKALILARHGAITWGETLEEAYMGMERIEHSSEILHKAYALNTPEPLPKEELQALRDLRTQIGNKLL